LRRSRPTISGTLTRAVADATDQQLRDLFDLIAASDPCLNNRFEQILTWAGGLATGIDPSAFRVVAYDADQARVLYAAMFAYHEATTVMHPGTGVDPAAIAGAFQAAFENLQYMMD